MDTSGIDPNEQPADAAVRECFEETGLLIRPDALIGVFGAPKFLIHYPNGDIAYYTTIAFRGSVVAGPCNPRDGELSALNYFSESECKGLTMSPSSRMIARKAFTDVHHPYFRRTVWTPNAMPKKNRVAFGAYVRSGNRSPASHVG